MNTIEEAICYTCIGFDHLTGYCGYYGKDVDEKETCPGHQPA